MPLDPAPMISLSGQRVPLADPLLGWEFWPRPEYEQDESKYL